MTDQQIKENAPYVETYYHPAEPLYIKLGQKYEVFIWFCGGWVRVKSKIKNGIKSGIKPLN